MPVDLLNYLINVTYDMAVTSGQLWLLKRDYIYKLGCYSCCFCTIRRILKIDELKSSSYPPWIGYLKPIRYPGKKSSLVGNFSNYILDHADLRLLFTGSRRLNDKNRE